MSYYQYSETLNLLYQILLNRLENTDLSPEQSAQISQGQIGDMADYMGGIPLYLPRGEKLKRALRDEQIWHQAKVLNLPYNHIAIKHKISVRQVQSIIAKRVNFQIAQQQTKLHF